MPCLENGINLVKKGKFVLLAKNADESCIFGECEGSAKDNYRVSVDFSEEKPVFRRSCPRRQFPCKHAIGLMIAFVQGKRFETKDIPEDILAKREKRQNKTETEP